MYFTSFATVDWIDVFVREMYCDELVHSLRYCIKEKGLLLYAWCIMLSHVHLIFKSSNNEPQKLLQEFQRFTAKSLLPAIRENTQEKGLDGLDDVSIWQKTRTGLPILATA